MLQLNDRVHVSQELCSTSCIYLNMLIGIIYVHMSVSMAIMILALVVAFSVIGSLTTVPCKGSTRVHMHSYAYSWTYTHIHQCKCSCPHTYTLCIYTCLSTLVEGRSVHLQECLLSVYYLQTRTATRSALGGLGGCARGGTTVVECDREDRRADSQRREDADLCRKVPTKDLRSSKNPAFPICSSPASRAPCSLDCPTQTRRVLRVDEGRQPTGPLSRFPNSQTLRSQCSGHFQHHAHRRHAALRGFLHRSNS
ncbi:putative transmembrane protein [Toxoplasma gondii TgCatPRC2]|uniref:Putative transmembrane protein n=1 Tax=Toxoplasma gondii TgCatPRC2 TaxID=1130821 RepID=A0A151HJ95_TOXGO|nr:putative transmembrane protein [Toxoplasma gondii TgCatPRC2]